MTRMGWKSFCNITDEKELQVRLPCFFESFWVSNPQLLAPAIAKTRTPSKAVISNPSFLQNQKEPPHRNQWATLLSSVQGNR